MSPKKGTLSEDDVCSLLQRYPAAAILTVLREVAQYPHVNINWDVLLNKTRSGIKSAREIQLLWRHLAYRHPLNHGDGDGDGGDDDSDSDLDFDVEAFPPLSSDASFEAANCVKVLAAGTSTECVMTNNANNEVDMPNTQASNNPTAPTLLPTSNVPQLASPQTEGIDPNSVNNLRKKRKWTEEEDSKLLACIQKWGEGNWNVISQHAQLGRTTTQLSQRWANMRRKQGNKEATTSTGPKLSEAQLATRRAIDMALKDNLTAVAGNGAAAAATGTSNSSKSKTKPTPTPTPTPTNGEPPVSSVIGLAQRQAGVKARPGGLKKGAPPPKPPSIIETISRTAVAAGARIANPSDAPALHNRANVRFFRSFPPTGGQVEASVKPSQPKTARNMPAAPSKKNLEAKVACSDPKLMVRVPDNHASLPQSLPPPPVVTKQTPAVGNSECAIITKGISANQSKDEALNPLPLSATQACANARLESVVDASTKKMESSAQGLPEAK